jgi:hypothetical protein
MKTDNYNDFIGTKRKHSACHWLLDSIEKERVQALALADQVQVYRELLNSDQDVDFEKIKRVAGALELAAMDLLLERFEENPENEKLLCRAAADGFRLLKLVPGEEPASCSRAHVLRASALGVLGERGSDVARWLAELEECGQWPELEREGDEWRVRSWSTTVDVWLRLIRKRGWEDRDAVLQRIADLREQQGEFEKQYLGSLRPQEAKASALELIGLYHVAKAAEILALFITDGAVEGNHQVQSLLDSHFDRAIAACDSARLVELEPIVKLLAATAEKLVNNSIWTVTRAGTCAISMRREHLR